MVDKAEKIYNDGKKSLESLLQEKAYSDVQKNLEDKGIDINNVSDEDIEILVAEKAKDMMIGIKGFGSGVIIYGVVSLLTGI